MHFMIVERPDLLLSQDSHLGQLLSKLRKEQFADVAPAASSVSRAQLLADFKKTPNFWQTYREAVRYFAIPRGQQEMAMLSGRFAGRLFQEIAYLSAANASAKTGEVVLCSDRTLHFYETLFPDRPKLVDPFDVGTIDGVSVPDGLSLGVDGRILTVWEYSLRGDYNYFAGKMEYFTIDARRYPELFGGAELKFVTPTFLENKPYGYTFFELPFAHGQLRDFKDSIYFHFRPDGMDSATLDEIQQRARWQIETGRRYREAGHLTQEYKRFLIRFAN